MRRLALGAFWRVELNVGVDAADPVLMHRLALGASDPFRSTTLFRSTTHGLNAPFGARCFLTCLRRIYDTEECQS